MPLDYLSLFVAAFLAATVLPFSSELLLFALLQKGLPALMLVAVASAGNTLGAIVNWGLGRWLLHFQNRRWFPASAEQLARAQRWFQHYGVWCLLLAWLPLVGDALTVIAGVMRVRLLWFVVLVGAGKTLRYAVAAGVAGSL